MSPAVHRLSFSSRILESGFFAAWALAIAVVTWHIVGRYPPDQYWLVAACGGAAIAAVVWPRWWLILSIGVAIRLALAATITTPLGDDPGSYAELAQAVRDGRGLIVSNPVYGPTLQAAFPPLYPLLLALAGSWLLLNLVIDVAASLLLRRLGGDRAAAIYFLFPSVILASIVPSKEGLAILILLGCMVTLQKSAWIYGALTGLLALTQPAWLPIAAVAFAWKSRHWRDFASAGAVAALVMLPWVVRNYLLFDQFVPLTTTAGLSIAVAVNGVHVPTIDMPFDEPGRSAAAAAQAFSAIAADPLHYIWNCVRQLVRAFLVDDDAVEYLGFAALPWVGAAAVAGQLAFAALVARARWPRPELRPFAWGLALNCLVFGGMWLEFSSRHRAFLIPLLILTLRSALPLPPQRGADRPQQ